MAPPAAKPGAASFARRNGGRALTLIALALLVLASLWLRKPGFEQGGFASHDVAGILYNGMVLERGGLPYVDTLELKAPGTFYLARVFAGPEARDIARFQVAANLWAVLALLAVAALAWRMAGRLAAVVAASLYALHDLVLDSMDANYVTWANLPQILAVGLGLEATRSASRRSRRLLWLLAGVFAGCAALAKRPSGIVLVVLLLMAGWSGWSGGRATSGSRRLWERLRARLRGVDRAAVVAVVAGFVVAHVPIASHYLARGQLGALVDGYLLSRWGLRYIGARELGWLAGVREGGWATAHFLGLPLVLAAFAIGVWLARGRLGLDAGSARLRREYAMVLVWLAATLLATSLGLRFYKGYFLAAVAPLCLLAAAPWGLLGARAPLRWPLRSLALALLVPLALRQALIVDRTRHNRTLPHDLGGRQIAAHLLANTEADDTIWVWGWHLWEVYPLTGRASASPIYKSLGILSQPNDDTWRSPGTPLRFVDSAYADRLLVDLERARPAYIVLGSTVPHRQFAGLRHLLRTHYRRDHRVRLGRVEFWRLRE